MGAPPAWDTGFRVWWVLQSLVGASRLAGNASDMQASQVATMLQRVGVDAGSRHEVQRMIESLERAGLRDGIRARPTTIGVSPTAAAPASVSRQLTEVLARAGL